MKQTWTRESLTKLTEALIVRGSKALTNRHFRTKLDRDQNLFMNQIVREANGNIAYKSVDFDLNGKTDEEIWSRIEQTPYLDVIEENAAVAIIKMAEKLKLVK
ncbi:MAG: hypothetical protein COV45_04705 [Deltaproteobacteria bacterium CG11_big_fil_rev_8_21_14_0_20_47_16]|nr:MAG: hypothetical protein COV45_04705 [Deltaproteobacteria bacterium CG11_big_fil_rev_8_21_14_0_20_47_16]